LNISNDVARHSLIYHYGLHTAPVGDCKPADVLQLIKNLAYVQIDPIKVVARAHDHILWSRKNQYRTKQLEHLLARDRAVFEHFCHDACLLPMEFLPFWQDYDLAERMFPADYRKKKVSEPERIQWLAVNALQRMGFGTAGDMMRFWEACSLSDMQQWCEDNQSRLQFVQIESVTGESNKAFILKEQRSRIANPPKPSNRLRIINPFDPLVRDRKRLEKIFGFEYTIEMYTPKDKRQYGYYVYPLLEYDRFVGRIEVRHSSESNLLHVDNLWPEEGIRFGKGRMQKLESELERLRKFCGAESVHW